MRVRSAKPADAAAIAAIEVLTWRQAYRGIVVDEFLETLTIESQHERWMRRLAAPEGSWVVVAQDESGGISGYLALARPGRDEDASTSAEVAALYVHPAHWREGIGGRLLRVALAELGRGDWQAVTVWVFEANARALAFYESFGFAADGSRKNFDRGRAMIRLVRRLREPEPTE